MTLAIGGAKEAQSHNAPELLRLVPGAERAGPAPSALRVMERLSHGTAPIGDIEDVRRRYEESRRPLLAPLEDVDSVFQVCPRSGDGPSVHVIRPQGSGANKNAPAIVYLHGGGWTVGTFDIYQPLCRQIANATGSVVVWVRYRLAPEHPFPAAFDDTRKALRWVHENHGWLGIDPARIGIAGDSAGGNLAAAACIAEREARSSFLPRFQILLYPCLDMRASMPSHHKFADGYLLTSELYDGTGRTMRAIIPSRSIGGFRPCSRMTCRACRRRSSSMPVSIPCATRRRPMPAGCAKAAF